MEISPIKGGTCRALPAFQPAGKPRVTAAMEREEMVVDTSPAGLVTTSVTTSGGGVITGSAEIFVSEVLWPKSALYVLFASSEDTMAPIEAEMDVLSAKGGVVYVGVERI